LSGPERRKGFDSSDAEAPSSVGPHVSVYRVVDSVELAYMHANGNYGSNRAKSGKYFALTIAGASAFARASINAGSTITRTTLPQSVVDRGFLFNDPGQYGAGLSVFFGERLLPAVYRAMTPPVIVSSAPTGPGP
jgi:hypothetical protein